MQLEPKGSHTTDPFVSQDIKPCEKCNGTRMLVCPAFGGKDPQCNCARCHGAEVINCPRCNLKERQQNGK